MARPQAGGTPSSAGGSITALDQAITASDSLDGSYVVCPVCFNAKQLDKGNLLPNAELAGSVQLWEWIGDEQATTFSY
jgi:hypothetical protein